MAAVVGAAATATIVLLVAGQAAKPAPPGHSGSQPPPSAEASASNTAPWTGWLSLRGERGPTNDLRAVRLIGGTLAATTLDELIELERPVSAKELFDLEPFASVGPRGVLVGVPAVGRTVLYDVSPSEGTVSELTLPTGLIHYAIWGPDNEHVLFVGIDSSTRTESGIFSLGADGLRKLAPAMDDVRGDHFVEQLSLTPDGTRLFARYCEAKCQGRVISLVGGGRVTELGEVSEGDYVGITNDEAVLGDPDCPRPCGWILLSLRDGSVVRVGSQAGTAVVAQGPLGSLIVHETTVPTGTDGQYKVAAFDLATKAERTLYSADTGDLTLVTPNESDVAMLPTGFVALSPDGRLALDGSSELNPRAIFIDALTGVQVQIGR